MSLAWPLLWLFTLFGLILWCIIHDMNEAFKNSRRLVEDLFEKDK